MRKLCWYLENPLMHVKSSFWTMRWVLAFALLAISVGSVAANASLQTYFYQPDRSAGGIFGARAFQFAARLEF
jgi:hypothetical protein